MELPGNAKDHPVKITPGKVGGFAFALLAILGLSFLMGMNAQQMISLGIVSSFVLGTVFFWEFRLAFAFLGMALLLATGSMNIERLVESSSVDVIIFLMGMMVFVGYLEKYHIFEYVLSSFIGNYLKDGRLFFISFMFLSALTAAMIDEVTSILFMVGLAISVSGKLKIDPLPLIMGSIFATNIGSSATVIGNPVGVMLALKTGLTFNDFMVNAAPVAFVALVAVTALLLVQKKKYIQEIGSRLGALAKGRNEYQKPEKLYRRLAFFAIILCGLVFHVSIEQSLGLGKNVLLVAFALFAGGLVILFERNNAREFFESKVDFWTLSFFLILFASAENLKNLGVTDVLAANLSSLLGSDSYVFAFGFFAITGFLSAALDNVVAVATFIPVVQSLQATMPAALAGNTLYWALLFAATFFGNLTIIGSTANIVAASLMEKRGIKVPSFMEWLSVGWKVVLLSSLVAMAAIAIKISFP